MFFCAGACYTLLRQGPFAPPPQIHSPTAFRRGRFASPRGLTWGCEDWQKMCVSERVLRSNAELLFCFVYFLFQFSPLSPDWLPTPRLSPPPLPQWLRGRQSRWLTWWVGLGGLNEGISRGSSQHKEAFVLRRGQRWQRDTLMVPSVTVVPPLPSVPPLAWWANKTNTYLKKNKKPDSTTTSSQSHIWPIILPSN